MQSASTFRRMLIESPNLVWVHGEDPVMDARYLLTERRPVDGGK